VFGARLLVGRQWSADLFEKYAAELGQPLVDKTPGGRRVKGWRAHCSRSGARLLVASLVPLAPAYPLPFMEVAA
jgi:hypothetical protein